MRRPEHQPDTERTRRRRLHHLLHRRMTKDRHRSLQYPGYRSLVRVDQKLFARGAVSQASVDVPSPSLDQGWKLKARAHACCGFVVWCLLMFRCFVFTYVPRAIPWRASASSHRPVRCTVRCTSSCPAPAAAPAAPGRCPDRCRGGRTTPRSSTRKRATARHRPNQCQSGLVTL